MQNSSDAHLNLSGKQQTVHNDKADDGCGGGVENEINSATIRHCSFLYKRN